MKNMARGEKKQKYVDIHYLYIKDRRSVKSAVFGESWEEFFHFIPAEQMKTGLNRGVSVSQTWNLRKKKTFQIKTYCFF
jgi:hypothetical protein